MTTKTKKQKLVSLRMITVKKDMKDITGWTIPKGTTLHVVNDSLPIHPTKGHKLIVCRVDNGTDYLNMMPETVIRDTDLK